MGMLKQSAEAAPAEEQEPIEDEAVETPVEEEAAPEGEAPVEETSEGEEGGKSEQASQMLHKILYQSGDSARKILSQFKPEEKIKSLVYTGMILVSQIGARLDLSNEEGAALADEVVPQLIELYTRVLKVPFSAKDKSDAADAMGVAYANAILSKMGPQAGAQSAPQPEVAPAAQPTPAAEAPPGAPV